MTRVLALVTAPSAESPAGTEFLRVLVALRAAGAEVALAEAGRGAGALTGGDPALEPGGERYLAALADDGVVAARGTDVPAQVAAADVVVVLPDPARPGRPPLLVLPRGERPSERIRKEMLEAGQVVIGSAFPTAS